MRQKVHVQGPQGNVKACRHVHHPWRLHNRDDYHTSWANIHAHKMAQRQIVGVALLVGIALVGVALSANA